MLRERHDNVMPARSSDDRRIVPPILPRPPLADDLDVSVRQAFDELDFVVRVADGVRQPGRDLNLGPKSAILRRMSSVKEIESALTRLSLEDLQVVRDWLDDLIEDQLEVSDEFKVKIQRAKQEIADGVYARVRKPETGE